MTDNHDNIYNSTILTKRKGADKSRLSLELQLFSCIYNGDLVRLNKYIGLRNQYTYIFRSKYSSDPLKQAKYTAVAFATLVFRVAIAGGIIESEAYKKCDAFVESIDKMNSDDDIYDYIFLTLSQVTHSVHDAHYSKDYPPVIRECTNYIYNNIRSKISLTQLADLCGLTPSYLSSLFKKETNMTISDYIMDEKMREAANLILEKEYSCVEISNMLGFCSQSYFCKCFKAKYNVTPLEYIENLFTFLSNQ